MQFNLAEMVRRQRNVRRKSIALRETAPPSTLATGLYQTYAQVITAWSQASETIMRQYRATLAEMATDSPADVNAEIERMQGAINSLMLTLTPEVREWAFSVERWQRNRWTSAILSGTGVDLSSMLGVGDVRVPLETAIEWNVSLIKDISDQARQRISNAVWDGLRNNRPARDVAASIREAVSMGRDRSKRIAADQLNKLNSSLADERRNQAGMSEWSWVHSGKRHPREDHRARNGFVYSDDPAMVGKTVEGKVVRTPPADRPGQLPYCGCRSLSVLIFED
ncbi:phage minor head protein [Sphingosinicella xenopeptidilytica]|uniref:Phage minor head protein n=1 Tax=Sphingosinicella xenopeptidilytica TaxID=364098 RepID=A0ABW3C3B7_SPHXN